MTIEERIKQMLGEQQFQIAGLITQLEEAQKKLADLQTQKEGSNVEQLVKK